MSIKEIATKIKSELSTEQSFAALLIVVVGVASFGLGRLSVTEETGTTPAVIGSAIAERTVYEEEVENLQPDTSVAVTETYLEEQEALYVASKNSDKYHLPWCGGAARISEANKVWFTSKAEAEAAGYTPAANCKGI